MRRTATGRAAPARRNGFTLIELLVTISVIAVVAGILLVAIDQASGKSKRAQAAITLAELTGALDSYRVEFGDFPPLDPADLDTDYDMVQEDVFFYFLQHGADPLSIDETHADFPKHDNQIFDSRRKRVVKGFINFSSKKYLTQGNGSDQDHKFLRDPWNSGGDDVTQVWRITDENNLPAGLNAPAGLDYYVYCLGDASISASDDLVESDGTIDYTNGAIDEKDQLLKSWKED